jgi:hypothetical protein
LKLDVKKRIETELQLEGAEATLSGGKPYPDERQEAGFVTGLLKTC